MEGFKVCPTQSYLHPHIINVMTALTLQLMFDRKIVTVWSAPNYCYRCGNVASLLELDENLRQEYKGNSP